FQATPLPTRLDHLMQSSVHRAPDVLARLGFAIARRLGGAGLPELPLDDAVAGFVDAVAQALDGAERPLIVSGAGVGSAALLQASAAVAGALAERGRTALLHLE